MIIKIVLGLLILLGVFLLIASFQPSDFRIQRATSIAAPADRIFPLVNHARAWEQWSPWVKLDPAARFSYEGPEAGVGAVTAWSGDKTGAGRSTIVESRAAELIRFRLDMTKPMTATNDVTFTFQPTPNGTVVTWAMSGSNNLLGKACSLFMNCDKMVGGEFEKGLADLKRLAETADAGRLVRR